jgi:predicted SAM-dependent methyltransferase
MHSAISFACMGNERPFPVSEKLNLVRPTLQPAASRQRNLIERLSAREYEFNLSILQLAYHNVERTLCHFLLRRNPPEQQSPNLLNLGCGPHIYPGWVNADDYAPKRRFRECEFKPDWTIDITRQWRCVDNYWDGIFTQHVIEHVPYADAINVLKECFRTLKPGAWIRISVPDLATYVRYYRHEIDDEQFFALPHRVLALSFLTQMHMHRSVWDADLMCQVLTELGFENAVAVSFGTGSDLRLIKDDPDKAPESLYVEARKPTH